jgi:hypothetical protein
VLVLLYESRTNDDEPLHNQYFRRDRRTNRDERSDLGPSFGESMQLTDGRRILPSGWLGTCGSYGSVRLVCS